MAIGRVDSDAAFFVFHDVHHAHEQKVFIGSNDRFSIKTSHLCLDRRECS